MYEHIKLSHVWLESKSVFTQSTNYVEIAYLDH